MVPALRARAEEGQRALRAEIQAWEAARAVSEVRAFWMVSGFALRATKDVVHALLARDDVAEVAFDGPLVLDEPVASSPAGFSPGCTPRTASGW